MEPHRQHAKAASRIKTNEYKNQTNAFALLKAICTYIGCRKKYRSRDFCVALVSQLPAPLLQCGVGFCNVGGLTSQAVSGGSKRWPQCQSGVKRRGVKGECCLRVECFSAAAFVSPRRRIWYLLLGTAVSRCSLCQWLQVVQFQYGIYCWGLLCPAVHFVSGSKSFSFNMVFIVGDCCVPLFTLSVAPSRSVSIWYLLLGTAVSRCSLCQWLQVVQFLSGCS